MSVLGQRYMSILLFMLLCEWPSYSDHLLWLKHRCSEMNYGNVERKFYLPPPSTYTQLRTHCPTAANSKMWCHKKNTLLLSLRDSYILQSKSTIYKENKEIRLCKIGQAICLFIDKFWDKLWSYIEKLLIYNN